MTTWADFDARAMRLTAFLVAISPSRRRERSVRPVTNTTGQHFSEWLNRRGDLDDATTNFKPGQQSTWWINYGTFEQGVGALGGGNVAVSAGGDLVNLLVALPTNARVRGGRTDGEARSLEMRNGGLMSVNAGRCDHGRSVLRRPR